MQRWLLALFWALGCHGVLLLMPLAKYNPAVPGPVVESGIRIHLATGPAPQRQSVPAGPGQLKREKDFHGVKLASQPDTGELNGHKAVVREKSVQPLPKITPLAWKKRKHTAATGNKMQNRLQPGKAAAPSAAKTQSADTTGAAVPSAPVKAIPLYNDNPKPAYPPLARRRNWQGTVILQVTVTERGRAKQVLIHTGSGYLILDTAARDTVKSWRFLPGLKDGRPATMKVLVPVHFRLQ